MNKLCRQTADSKKGKNIFKKGKKINKETLVVFSQNTNLENCHMEIQDGD